MWSYKSLSCMEIFALSKVWGYEPSLTNRPKVFACTDKEMTTPLFEDMALKKSMPCKERIRRTYSHSLLLTYLYHFLADIASCDMNPTDRTPIDREQKCLHSRYYFKRIREICTSDTQTVQFSQKGMHD